MMEYRLSPTIFAEGTVPLQSYSSSSSVARKKSCNIPLMTCSPDVNLKSSLSSCVAKVELPSRYDRTLESVSSIISLAKNTLYSQWLLQDLSND